MARQPAEGKGKKLTGAVEHLLSGGRKVDSDAVMDQAALLRLDPGQVIPDDDPDYDLWPEHENAALMFMRCQTQWRSTGGGVVGLDYNVVLQLMGLYDVPDRVAVLEDLQVMEARAVELINDQARKG
jgi:hypothetical protein